MLELPIVTKQIGNLLKNSLATIHVYILSADGIIRNKSLVSSLEKMGFLCKIISGYHVDQKFENETTNLQLRQEELSLGRKLSPYEIAAMLTHRKAQLQAIKDKRVIFLEDDAILGKKFTFETLTLIFENLEKFKNATVVSFYAEKWSVFIPVKLHFSLPIKLLKAIFPPAGAVGYVMSSAALSKAVSSRIDFDLPTDWQSWAKSVDFYFAFEDFISTPGENSMSIIGSRKNIKFDFRIFMISLLKMEVTLSAIRHRIIQPLIWKIAQKIGKPYRTCSESELKSISRTFVLPDSKVFR